MKQSENFEEVRKIYNRIADAYQEKRENPAKSTWNDFLEAPSIDKLLSEIVLTGKKVLDLGCGTGLLSIKLHNAGADVFGIDLSEKMISLAKLNFPTLKFDVGNAAHTSFRDGEFDVIASSFVMHYVKNLKPVFKEMSRILKKGGQFVFSMHHPFNFKKIEEEDSVKVLATPYFTNNEKYFWNMCDTKIVSFHHTFEDVVSGLYESGFLTQKIIECRPSKDSKDHFKDYDFTSKFPTFCVFQALRTE